MDIKQLRYFVTIVNTKSFSTAAKYLYVSQSTLSKSVQALEDELQVQLIYFTGKKMYTTGYGTELFNLAQNLLLQFDSIPSSINSIKTMIRGRLRIGIPPIIGACIFPEIMENFHSIYPGIELQISQHSAKEVQLQTAAHLLDFGFSLTPIPDNVNSEKIMHSDCVVVVNRSHPLSEKASIEYTDLINDQIILLDETFKYHDAFLLRCEKAGFIPNISMRLKDYGLILRMVQHELGITILPRQLVNLFIPDNCVSIPFSGGTFGFDFMLIYPKDIVDTVAAKAFHQHILKQVREKFDAE